MPRLGDLYPSKYLVADDIPEEGIIVTVRSVEIDKMRDGTAKPVLYFDEIEKGLVCNKTNANTIGKMYGDDTDNWEDERVTLFPSEVSFNGEMVACIRVKPKKPKPAIKETAERANGKAPDGGKKNKVMTQAEVDDGDDDDSVPF